MEAEWLGICAEAGNSWCRHTLARDYRNGSAAFSQNFAKAMAWYVVLVDQPVGEPDSEQPSAEYEIGQMYAIGQGVAQNYRKAMEWYVRGANTADSSSLKRQPEFALGDLYEHGRGVDQDYRVASEWYQKAADDEFAEARIALARLYASGQGVPQSDRLALIWYFKVAASSSYSATLEQRQKAREQLFAVFEKAKCVPADDREAVEWYRDRAGEGDTFARRGLALSYELGYRVGQNHSVALAIDTVLTHDLAVPEDDVVHELIPKQRDYRPRDLAPLLNKILEPGQFLVAIDEFIAHPPPPVITLTP
jgi:TPR repeat protein